MRYWTEDRGDGRKMDKASRIEKMRADFRSQYSTSSGTARYSSMEGSNGIGEGDVWTDVDVRTDVERRWDRGGLDI